MVEVKQIFLGTLQARIEKELPMHYLMTCQECHREAWALTGCDAFLAIQHVEGCTYALMVAAEIARRARMSFAVWERELVEAGKL